MEPEDLHEWVSFEDTEEERTWVFDLTFLLSNWTCIYGRGCPGVLTGPAPELEHGCCSYGAHFVGDEDLEATLAHAERLTETQWQFKKLAAKRGGADPRHPGRRSPHPPRRRSLHLPQSHRLRGRRRVCAAPCGGRARRATRSTGSPTSAGSSRSGCPRRPTSTATSPRPCVNGSVATGATAVRSSTGGAPTPATPSSARRPSTGCSPTRSSR